jgi:hypothetical protein
MIDTVNIQIWEQYKASGLHVLPISMPPKIPAIPEGTSWKPDAKNYHPERWRFNGSGAIACGTYSGNIEVIDFDTKHTTRDLMTEYFDEGGEELNDIFCKKLVAQTTISGGYHFIYRCEKIEGNQKLAISADGKKALIETRGKGGYFVVAPTDGYNIFQGDITNIQTITPEERDFLITTARKLTEYFPEAKKTEQKNKNDFSGLTPWDDFDKRGDVPALLQKHGWQYLRTVGDNDRYCRPEKTGTTSATWNEKLRVFFMFTSSTIFELGKGYSASAVFAHLECNKDFSEAGKKLYALGFGDRQQTKKEAEPEKKKELTPDEIQTLWKDRLITTEPPDDIPILNIEKIPVLIQGNHTVIVGKKKSRKTLFLVWLLSQFKGNVLFFDTEQGRKHVWLIRQKIKQLNGTDLPVFFLRGMSPKDRRDFIYQTVKLWEARPQVVVIDGIRDLMSNINDPDESTELIVWLETLIKEFNCGVLNVLHLNKTDNNARGHIGTELGNKSFMVVEVEKDSQTGVSVVKCADSRDEPFENFAFTHGAEGLPELVGMPSKGRVLTEAQQRDLIKHSFDEQVLSYAELVEAVKLNFDIGLNKAKGLVEGYVRKGWIVKSGKARSKDARYKLMI